MTFELRKLMTCFGYHGVHLVDTRRNICILMRQRCQSLTPVHGHKWNQVLSQVGHAPYQFMRLCRETHWGHLQYLFYRVRGKQSNSTSYDLEWPEGEDNWIIIMISVAPSGRASEYFPIALWWWCHKIDLISGYRNQNSEMNVLQILKLLSPPEHFVLIC